MRFMTNQRAPNEQLSIKNSMGPYQRTPREVARSFRFSGLGVRSVGPVGDFLEVDFPAKKMPSTFFCLLGRLASPPP